MVDGALVAVQGSPNSKKKGREHKAASPSRAPSSASASVSRWNQAWEALRTASKFRVDEDGEVALKFCDGLATIYRACCDGKGELAEVKRVLELLDLLQDLVPPRYSMEPSGSKYGKFRPQVTGAQRQVSVWATRTQHPNGNTNELEGHAPQSTRVSFTTACSVCTNSHSIAGWLVV